MQIHTVYLCNSNIKSYLYLFLNMVYVSFWSSGIFQVGIMIPGTSAQSGNDSLLNVLILITQALLFIFRSIELECPHTPLFHDSRASCDPCELKIRPLVQLWPNLAEHWILSPLGELAFYIRERPALSEQQTFPQRLLSTVQRRCQLFLICLPTG